MYLWWHVVRALSHSLCFPLFGFLCLSLPLSLSFSLSFLSFFLSLSFILSLRLPLSLSLSLSACIYTFTLKWKLIYTLRSTLTHTHKYNHEQTGLCWHLAQSCRPWPKNLSTFLIGCSIFSFNSLGFQFLIFGFGRKFFAKIQANQSLLCLI